MSNSITDRFNWCMRSIACLATGFRDTVGRVSPGAARISFDLFSTLTNQAPSDYRSFVHRIKKRILNLSKADGVPQTEKSLALLKNHIQWIKEKSHKVFGRELTVVETALFDAVLLDIDSQYPDLPKIGHYGLWQSINDDETIKTLDNTATLFIPSSTRSAARNLCSLFTDELIEECQGAVSASLEAVASSAAIQSAVAFMPGGGREAVEQMRASLARFEAIEQDGSEPTSLQIQVLVRNIDLLLHFPLNIAGRNLTTKERENALALRDAIKAAYPELCDGTINCDREVAIASFPQQIRDLSRAFSTAFTHKLVADQPEHPLIRSAAGTFTSPDESLDALQRVSGKLLPVSTRTVDGEELPKPISLSKNQLEAAIAIFKEYESSYATNRARHALTDAERSTEALTPDTEFIEAREFLESLLATGTSANWRNGFVITSEEMARFILPLTEKVTEISSMTSGTLPSVLEPLAWIDLAIDTTTSVVSSVTGVVNSSADLATGSRRSAPIGDESITKATTSLNRLLLALRDPDVTVEEIRELARQAIIYPNALLDSENLGAIIQAADPRSLTICVGCLQNIKNFLAQLANPTPQAAGAIPATTEMQIASIQGFLEDLAHMRSPGLRTQLARQGLDALPQGVVSTAMRVPALRNTLTSSGLLGSSQPTRGALTDHAPTRPIPPEPAPVPTPLPVAASALVSTDRTPNPTPPLPAQPVTAATAAAGGSMGAVVSALGTGVSMLSSFFSSEAAASPVANPLFDRFSDLYRTTYNAQSLQARLANGDVAATDRSIIDSDRQIHDALTAIALPGPDNAFRDTVLSDFRDAFPEPEPLTAHLSDLLMLSVNAAQQLTIAHEDSDDAFNAAFARSIGHDTSTGTLVPDQTDFTHAPHIFRAAAEVAAATVLVEEVEDTDSIEAETTPPDYTILGGFLGGIVGTTLNRLLNLGERLDGVPFVGALTSSGVKVACDYWITTLGRAQRAIEENDATDEERAPLSAVQRTAILEEITRSIARAQEIKEQTPTVHALKEEMQRCLAEFEPYNIHVSGMRLITGGPSSRVITPEEEEPFTVDTALDGLQQAITALTPADSSPAPILEDADAVTNHALTDASCATIKTELEEVFARIQAANTPNDDGEIDDAAVAAELLRAKRLLAPYKDLPGLSIFKINQETSARLTEILEEAQAAAPVQHENIDWSAKTNREKDKFVTNLTFQSTYSAVYETFLGARDIQAELLAAIESDVSRNHPRGSEEFNRAVEAQKVARGYYDRSRLQDETYQSIMRTVSDPRVPESEKISKFKTALREKIENRDDIGRFKKFVSKWVFLPFLAWLIPFLGKRFANTFLKSLRERIKEVSALDRKPVNVEPLNRTSDFLAGYLGATRKWVTDGATTSRQAYLKEELTHPEYNHGKTIKEVQDLATANAVNKYVPNVDLMHYPIDAMVKVKNACFLSDWEPESSPAKGFKFILACFLTIVATPTVFLGLGLTTIGAGATQFITNKVIKFGTKKFLLDQQMLDFLVKKGLNSVGSPSTSLAINKVIAKQLREICEEIENGSDGELPTDEAPRQTKEAIERSVRLLIETIRIRDPRFDVARNLRTFLDGNQGLLDSLPDTIRDKALPIAVESVSGLLYILYRKCLEEGFIEEQLASILEISNEAMIGIDDEETLQAEATKAEEEVYMWKDRLLRSSIRAGVRDNLTGLGITQRQKCDKLTNWLKASLIGDDAENEGCLASWDRALTEYANPATRDYRALIEARESLASYISQFRNKIGEYRRDPDLQHQREILDPIFNEYQTLLDRYSVQFMEVFRHAQSDSDLSTSTSPLLRLQDFGAIKDTVESAAIGYLDNADGRTPTDASNLLRLKLNQIQAMIDGEKRVLDESVPIERSPSLHTAIEESNTDITNFENDFQVLQDKLITLDTLNKLSPATTQSYFQRFATTPTDATLRAEITAIINTFPLESAKRFYQDKILQLAAATSNAEKANILASINTDITQRRNAITRESIDATIASLDEKATSLENRSRAFIQQMQEASTRRLSDETLASTIRSCRRDVGEITRKATNIENIPFMMAQLLPIADLTGTIEDKLFEEAKVRSDAIMAMWQDPTIQKGALTHVLLHNFNDTTALES